MKTILAITALIGALISSPVHGEVYAPTAKVGEFLRQFEKAYRSGDREWIQSAIDKEGIVEEAKAVFLGFLGPKGDGEAITDLSVIAAPENYKVSNTLLDIEVEETLPVDFIVTFKRMVGISPTMIKVPVGYRDGKIYVAGIRKK